VRGSTRTGPIAARPVVCAAVAGALCAVVFYGHPTDGHPTDLSASGAARSWYPASGVGQSLRVDLDRLDPPPHLPTLPPTAPPAPSRRVPAVPVARADPTPLPGCDARAETVVALLDEDRAANGIGSLVVDAGLCRAAAVHAAQNAAQDRMFHDGLSEDVAAQHVTWHSLGEVLGYWHPTPDAASINRMWMGSQEHRPIILTPGFTRVGVGWAQAANGDWFVSAILAD
jgi:uncharacterized protein YkwD